jgi:hypothetical protein
MKTRDLGLAALAGLLVGCGGSPLTFAFDAGSADTTLEAADANTPVEGGQDGDAEQSTDATADVSGESCVENSTRSCATDGLLGNCAVGTETCTNSKWSACSVMPMSKDRCDLPGDDSTCDGTQNGDCPCVTGNTQPCGPAQTQGICKRGVQTCSDGQWGVCQGAVFATGRDCTSPLDNDCDGKPDNTIDSVCACSSPTKTQPCGAHPEDGKGACHAGTQTCVIAADKASGVWGACTGSVGPAAVDACVYGNDDRCNDAPVGSAANTDCSCGGFTMPNPSASGEPNLASYTRNSDSTVTDNVTGLVWEGTVDATTYTQADAEQHCQAKPGGWRLPTRIELVSLIDFTIASPGPTINSAAFPGATADPFWTSSSSAAAADYGWNVTFYIGDANVGFDKGTSKVRCVRGSPKCYKTRFTIQGAGVVQDNATGLIWQMTLDPSSRTWADAKPYCAALGASWRLPSVNELQTIVDDTKSAPSIDSNVFPQTPGKAFWTSSAFAGDPPGSAWLVAFDLGTASFDDGSSLNSVRCVR